MNLTRYCTFYVDGLLLGIAVDRVEEVLRDQTVTPVPLAHPGVAGLINLRGQVVTAVDARRRLGLGGWTQPSTPTVMVIRSGGEAVALLVDRADEVVDIGDHQLEALPENVSADIRALTVGAYQLDEHLLVVLDPDQMLVVAS
jgi:purine-binding chemotaxis protein CheW